MAKILLIDIETTPSLSYVWGHYQQDVIAVEKEWYILCFAYHWLDDRGPVKCIAQTDFPERYAANPEDDTAVCFALHALLSEADVVVAHNLDKFDARKINARLWVHGFDPPAPYKHVDTLKVCRKHFAFNSNRLADVCEMAGIGTKGETGGFRTWLDCMKGDPAAWAKMIEYNIQDVVILEALYRKLLPWIDNHPPVGLLDDRPKACPKCGSEAGMIARKYHVTKVQRRRYFQCASCGGYSLGRKLENTAVSYIN
jgi:RNase_H superfamily